MRARDFPLTARLYSAQGTYTIHLTSNLRLHPSSLYFTGRLYCISLLVDGAETFVLSSLSQ